MLYMYNKTTLWIGIYYVKNTLKNVEINLY